MNIYYVYLMLPNHQKECIFWTEEREKAEKFIKIMQKQNKGQKYELNLSNSELIINKNNKIIGVQPKHGD